MNNRGFTLIELITTFALSTAIIVIFINLVLIVKNIYYMSNKKTELLINQGNLSIALNSKLYKDNLTSYSSCDDSDFCYIFTFSDESSSKLIVDDNKIQFGDYVYVINSSNYILTPTFEIKNIDIDSTKFYDSILIINIPIKDKLYPNLNFGVKVIYQFNSNKTSL